MEAWTFGEQPLDGVAEVASLLRDVMGMAIALEQPTPALTDLADALRAARRDLAPDVPCDLAPRTGPDTNDAQRVYLDHSRDVGVFNACFPLYELHSENDHAVGSVEFPLVFEGPPGIVHGGALALFFDCALQQMNCDLGQSGRTTSLAIRYRRPTPVLTRLEIRAERNLSGERFECHGALINDGVTVCEADMRAVAADRSKLPFVSPRRSAG